MLSLESLSSLGFEETNLGCPETFAASFARMSRTPGGVQKVSAKKVRAHFSFPMVIHYRFLTSAWEGQNHSSGCRQRGCNKRGCLQTQMNASKRPQTQRNADFGFSETRPQVNARKRGQTQTNVNKHKIKELHPLLRTPFYGSPNSLPV